MVKVSWGGGAVIIFIQHFYIVMEIQSEIAEFCSNINKNF